MTEVYKESIIHELILNYTTGLLTPVFLCGTMMTENREARPFGKEIQMFNIRFTFAIAEYERDFVSCAEREGFYEVRPYENGKSIRLNSPE